MPFQMSFDKEDLKGPEPVPPGIYTVQFVKFAPKLSSKKDSINLNAQVKIINHPDYTGRMLFAGLNTKIPAWIQDFVLSFGLEMEGMLSDKPQIPGVFDADKAKFKEDDPSTYVYEGPLTGRTAQWEVGVGPDDKGVERNAPKMFIPAITDLAVRFPHVKTATNMMRNK